MKKQRVFVMAMLALVLVLALVLAGCGEPKPEFDEEFDVTAANFNSTINSIRSTPGKYLIKLTGDALNQNGITLETAGVDITVKGDGANKITWMADRLFLVRAGKLTLENIAMSPVSGSRNKPLAVEGGTAEIKNGVTISNPGNTAVEVSSGGVFIMSGGTIENSDNGVKVTGGNASRITISSGTIRNITYDGIALDSSTANAVVNVSGGSISVGYHGIMVDGNSHTVTISGGTVHGGAQGNGVAVEGSGHTVRKTGGTVTGGNGAIDVRDSAVATATVTGF